MALKNPERPETDVETIGDALFELSRGAEGTDLPPTQLAAPLPVYNLDVASVLERSLGRATVTGWRYVLLSGEKAMAVVEVRHRDSENESGQFSHFEHGAVVEDSMRFFRIAEDFAAEHNDRNYELRFLDIPAVHTRAFWLRPADDGEEVVNEDEGRVIPLPSPQTGLIAGTPCRPTEFLEILSASAEEYLAYAESPEEEVAPRSAAKPDKPGPKKAKHYEPACLSDRQLRTMHRANSVRIPQRWDVGELSLRKHGGNCLIQVSQERGYATERRIIDLADVLIVCFMEDKFKTLVEDPASQVTKEDWDEWDPAHASCLTGVKEALKELKKLKDSESFTGAVYVRSNANVLVVAEFGLPASHCVDWKSPLPPPESLEGGTGRHC